MLKESCSIKEYYKLEYYNIPLIFLLINNQLSKKEYNCLISNGVSSYNDLINLSIENLLKYLKYDEVLDIVVKLNDKFNIKTINFRRIIKSELKEEEKIQDNIIITKLDDIDNIVNNAIDDYNNIIILNNTFDGLNNINIARQIDMSIQDVNDLRTFYINRLTKIFKSSNIFNFLYDLSDDGYIEYEDLYMIHTKILLLILKNIGSDKIKFSKKYDCFFITTSNYLHHDYDKYVKKLPKIIEKENFEKIITESKSNYGIPRKFLYKIIECEYYEYDNKYYNNNYGYNSGEIDKNNYTKSDITLNKDLSIKENYKLDDIDVSISMLDLSVRSYNSLRRAGISNYNDLIRMRVADIENIRNLGDKSKKEILNKITDIERINKIIGSFNDNKTNEKQKQHESYNINEHLDQIINSIIKNNDRKQIIILRDKGLTLEETGKLMGKTRERIRQIESNIIKNLAHKIRYCGLHVILENYADNGYIDAESIKKIFNIKDIIILLYVLKSSSIYGIRYLKEYDCFLVNKDIFNLEECKDKLPEYIDKSSIESIVNDISENNNLPSKLLLNIIRTDYEEYGKCYSKNKITLKYAIINIIDEYFPRGIKINDKEEMTKFANYLHDQFSFDYRNSARYLINVIRDNCILIDDGVYRPNMCSQYKLNDKIINKICKFIKGSKHKAILLNHIYEKFKDDADNKKNYNKYIFIDILKDKLKSKYYFTRDYLKKTQEATIDGDIVNYIKRKKGIVLFSQLEKEFPYTPKHIFNRIFLRSDDLMNLDGCCVHIDNLNITNNDKKNLYYTLNRLLKDKETHHIDEVFKVIQENHYGILAKNGFDKPYKLYTLLKNLFKKEYNFSRPWIAKKNVSIEKGIDKLLKFIIKKTEVPINSLRGIAKDYHIHINSYIDFVNDNIDYIMFKDNKTIISYERIKNDLEQLENIDDVINDYMGTEKIKSIYRFNRFDKLYKLSIKWDYWLLYSVIKLFSSQFDTVTTINNLEDGVPLIIRRGYKAKDEEYQKFYHDKPIDWDALLIDSME